MSVVCPQVRALPRFRTMSPKTGKDGQTLTNCYPRDSTRQSDLVCKKTGRKASLYGKIRYNSLMPKPVYYAGMMCNSL